MLREFLRSFAQSYTTEWDARPELYAISRSGPCSVNEPDPAGHDEYVATRVKEINGPIEIEIVSTPPLAEAHAYLIVAEAYSEEEAPDGTIGTYEIRYFHGATRQGEIATLITYRDPGQTPEFDDAKGPATVCMQALLGIASGPSMGGC